MKSIKSLRNNNNNSNGNNNNACYVTFFLSFPFFCRCERFYRFGGVALLALRTAHCTAEQSYALRCAVKCVRE